MRRLATVAAAVALMLFAVACSVSTGGDPVAVASDGLPAGLLPSTTQPPATTSPPSPTERFVYFVDNRLDQPKLVQVSRIVEGGSVRATLLNLIEMQPEEGLTTQWAPEYAELSVDEDANNLSIDFIVETGEEDVLQGLLNNPAAVAQVVFTVSQFENVESVTFEINGEPASAATIRANVDQSEPVEQCDYRLLIPEDNDFGTNCPPETVPSTTTTTAVTTTSTPVSTTTTTTP